MSFLWGFLSNFAAMGVVWVSAKILFPMFQDKALYKGVRIEGIWDVYEIQDGRKIKSTEITFTQLGSRITASSHRIKTRSGAKNDRKFRYKGHIHKNQVTLTFEDAHGDGFDCGSYILCIHNNMVEMEGKATFHGKTENRIVSEDRFLKKTAKQIT